MTISDQVAYEVATATGSSPNFVFNHPCRTPNELSVKYKESPSTAEVTWTYGVNFTVTGTPDADGNYPSGLTVVASAGNPPAGAVVAIERSVYLTQTADYTTSGKFPAETHEKALDKLTMAIQDLKRLVARCVVFTATSGLANIILPAPVANKAIGWNATADQLINDPADFATTVTTVTAQAAAAASSASAAATSQTGAATSATSASTSASSASTSATSASTSATSAATSASNANTSAINAASSATSATSSKNAAATSATNAATSETNAAASASSASTSASTATTQATNSASSASASASSASAASTSASNASSSATAAANSAAQAAATAAGLSNKSSCRVATTANLNATYANGSSGVGATLTNAGTLAAFALDGVSPNVNDRVLVKDQGTGAQNGIYTLTTVGSGSVAWVLTRATDYDTAAEILEGTFTLVEEGTANAGTLRILTTNTAVTVGTTALTFGTLSLSAGTVTNVATAGLATGGPITNTGTVTVTAAAVSDAITGTDTSKAVTSAALAGIWAKGTDIASASTLTIPSTGGGYFVVTGTTTVTAISEVTTHNGRRVTFKFSGALTLTHNATSLILPGSANITTSAGDVATFVTEDSTNWRCVGYQRADGKAVISSTAAFTAYAESSNITITSGGSWSFSPGLGANIKSFDLYLKNTSAELNYSVGDMVRVSGDNSYSTNNTGCAAYLAASAPTNINGRFGTATGIFEIQDVSLATKAAITNSKWALVARAWA